MKTNSIKFILVLFALGVLSIYQVHAQTKGSGTITISSGCTTANDGGVAGNTSIGCNAGKSGMTGAYNTSLGESAGNALSSGYSNTFSGYQSGLANTTGYYNTFLGAESGKSVTTGISNTFLGFQSGIVNTASQNTFTGTYSGVANTTGNYNSFYGYGAGYANVSGVQNAYIGGLAGRYSTGNYNSFLGCNAGYTNTSGQYNTFTGWKAGYYNTTGNYNTFNGNNAGYQNTTASNNTALGYLAGQYITTGGNNTCLGYNTGGSSNTTGTNNTFVGYGAISTGNYTNSTAIGYNATVSASNSLVLGNNANVGIGTSTPGSTLDVKGTIRLSGSTSGYVGFAPAAVAGSTTYTLPSSDGSSGQVLKTDGSGNLSWITPSTPSTSWQLNGNSSLGSDFLGSTDNNDVNFRRNNSRSGLLGTTNTCWGASSLIDPFTFNAYYNTAIGVYALNAITYGDYNTALGYYSLKSNTTGYNNVGAGANTLYSNTTGYDNIAVGTNALYSNTTGIDNTAIGDGALYSNTTSEGNTATGTSALTANTTGEFNSALGSHTLEENTTGNYNVAVGTFALLSSDADENTAVGWGALESNVSGSGNTALGSCAFYTTVTNYSNSTALGANTVITASNQIRLGDNSVTSIGGWANWTNISDKRVKKDINENVPGLDFILKLKPVTYHLDMNRIAELTNIPDSVRNMKSEKIKGEIIQTGFIAQEVEDAAIEVGYSFSGVDKPKNENDLYGLCYAEFTVPLVKAVQELNYKVDSLLAITNSENYKNFIQNSEELLKRTNENTTQVELSNINQIILYQNEPNPFSESTVIRYFIPENSVGTAYITFYDSYGKEIKRMELTTKSYGSVNVNAEKLTSGIYSYSLIVNDKVIETKKMMKNN